YKLREKLILLDNYNYSNNLAKSDIKQDVMEINQIRLQMEQEGQDTEKIVKIMKKLPDDIQKIEIDNKNPSQLNTRNLATLLENVLYYTSIYEYTHAKINEIIKELEPFRFSINNMQLNYELLHAMNEIWLSDSSSI
ncbi:MAG: hypothetical protein MHPSP_000719, partial [Paramarteilia canceri]